MNLITRTQKLPFIINEQVNNLPCDLCFGNLRAKARSLIRFINIWFTHFSTQLLPVKLNSAYSLLPHVHHPQNPKYSSINYSGVIKWNLAIRTTGRKKLENSFILAFVLTPWVGFSFASQLFAFKSRIKLKCFGSCLVIPKKLLNYPQFSRSYTPI